MTEAISWIVMAAGCYLVLLVLLLRRFRYGYLRLLGASSLLLFGGVSALVAEAHGDAGPVTAILVCLSMPWWTYNFAIACRLIAGKPVVGWRGYLLAVLAMVAYAVLAGYQTDDPDLVRAPGALAMVIGQAAAGATLLGHARRTGSIGAWLAGVASLGEGVLVVTYPLTFHFDMVLVVGGLASGVLMLLQGSGVVLLTHERAQLELRTLTETLTAELARQMGDLERASALAEMGQTAAVVAHEVKNQLNVISLGIALLTRELPDTERVATYEARVRRGLQESARLLRGLLAISRFGPPSVEPVALVSLIDAQLESLPDPVRPTLSFTAPLVPVTTDPRWFGLILRDLVEASPGLMPRGGTLTVTEIGRPVVTLQLPPAGQDALPTDGSDHPSLLVAQILMTGLGGALTMEADGSGRVAIVLDLAGPMSGGGDFAQPEPIV